MSATFFKIKNNNKGVTLIETILYMIILTFVMGVIVNMLVSIGGMYRQIKVTRELESSGAIAMETMLREIRNASSVVIGESSLGTTPGALTVSGIDHNSNPYKAYFSVNGGILQVSKNGGLAEALTSSSGGISYLVFTRVSTSTSEGVKIQLEVSGTSGSSTRTERFEGFSVMRGSY